MPQLQTTVLTDRKATPEAHSFLPRDIASGVASLHESTGVPIGDSRFTISLKRTESNRFKTRLTLTVPIVETQTINGIDSPRVVRTAYADVNFTFDETSSEAERNDVVGMVQDALRANNALVNDVVVKLQSVY